MKEKDNDDYIFGKLESEKRYIEQENKRINDRIKQSQKNWLEKILEGLGLALAAPFKLLQALLEWLF